MPYHVEITEPSADTVWCAGWDYSTDAAPAGVEPFEGMTDPADPVFDRGFATLAPTLADAMSAYKTETAAGWTCTIAWPPADNPAGDLLVVTNNPTRRTDRQPAYA